MNTNIYVQHNEEGIVNTGDYGINEVHITKNETPKTDDIKWETLNQEINVLKSSPDSVIKKFAYEAEEVAQKKDKQGLLKILSTWIPCIADFISSSYYIIEIAKTLK